jgi:hypothetical protein
VGKNDDTMDAAQAFEELQREVALQRQAIEALGDAVARHPIPDLGNEMAMLLKGQMQLLERFKRQEELGAAQGETSLSAPEQRHILHQAGQELIKHVRYELGTVSRDLASVQMQLTHAVGTVREGQDQWWWLATWVVSALLIGMALLPLVVRMLPAVAGQTMALVMMREDGWTAGGRLMQATSPASWAEMVHASALAQANDAVLKSCQAAAEKTRREQRCLVTVLPP